MVKRSVTANCDVCNKAIAEDENIGRISSSKRVLKTDEIASYCRAVVESKDLCLGCLEALSTILSDAIAERKEAAL